MPLPVIAAAWVIGTAATSGAGLGGVGFKKQWDAKKLVTRKQNEMEAVDRSTIASRVDCERAFAELGQVKLVAMSEALVPFHEAFSALKNVELETAYDDEGSPTIDRVSVAEAGRLSVGALDLIAGAAVAGGAAFAASQAATAGVAALATASTGTAISGLSGAAASNATLAWLGGGTLASGGGGMAAGAMVAGGVAAAPAILVGGVFLLQKGRQAQGRADAFVGDANTVLAHHRCSQLILQAAGGQATAATEVLRLLTVRLAMRCGRLQALVARENDWRALGPEDREQVREVAILAMATSDLIHTPIMADSGELTRAIRAALDHGATMVGVAVDA